MKKVIDVTGIQRLAPMAVSTMRLVNMVYHPKTCASAISRVVEMDSALTANLLRYANSAWSGSSVPIASVQEAVVRLGVDNLLKLAIGGPLSQSMRQALPEYGLQEDEFWRHNVVAGLTIECLNERGGEKLSPAGFTAALLHDIGKLLMAKYLPPANVDEIIRRVRENRIPYCEAEKEVAGVDHAEVGGEIARHWCFPEQLVYVIENHHHPASNPDPLLNAVQLANAVSKIIGVGMGHEQMNMAARPDLLQQLGMSIRDLESLCVAVKDRLAAEEEKWAAMVSDAAQDE